MSESAREGGCLCGAIRYRITGEPLAVSVCHCTDCQRQSGSAFSMSLVARREQLTVLTGEPAQFRGHAESGADKNGFFCHACGTRLYNTLSSMPDTVNVKPGTLDDTRWLDPTLQVWTASRQPWLTLPEGLRAFERNPRRRGG